MDIENNEQFYTEIQACKVIVKYFILVASIISLAITIVWVTLRIADILGK